MAARRDVTPHAAGGWRRFGKMLFLVALVGVPWIGAAPIHFAAPIEGRVIDAVTKEPLRGVVVVADWPRHCGVFQPSTCGRFAVHEAITGDDGRYRVKGWGPKLRALGFGDFDVDVYFFKHGYWKKRVGNPWPGSLRMGLWNRADWIHEVALDPVAPTDATSSAKYASQLDGLATLMEAIQDDGIDPRSTMPALIEELTMARRGLGQ